VASPKQHSEEDMQAQFEQGQAGSGFAMDTVIVQVD
jgi:hypothetical protein